MATSEQNAMLFEDSERPAAAGQPKQVEVPCNLKLRSANRDQLELVTIDVEQLLPPHHKAQAIAYRTGKMDLSAFFQRPPSVSRKPGHCPWDPRLLAGERVGCMRWVKAFQRMSQMGVQCAR